MVTDQCRSASGSSWTWSDRIQRRRHGLFCTPFVILDEATASVDTITERKIQEALDRLVAQRTVLVIAHRLSTVRRADKIVVMEQGRIIESGNHEALIELGGHYADLWAHQSDLIPEYN